MIKRKLKLFYKSIVKLFFETLYGNITLPKTTRGIIKKIEIEKTFFKPFKNKHYKIYIVKNSRIYTDNNENVAIIKNNTILPHISFQQVYGQLRNHSYNSVLNNGTPAFVKKIKGKIFNLCQGASGNNYFHFLFDIIPKIYLLSSKIDLNQIDFFYVSEPKKWQIEILKILGINQKKLLNSKIYKHISADEIYAVDHPWYMRGFVNYEIRNMPEWVVLSLREKFLKYSKKIPIADKIFIDRSDSIYDHCKLTNNKEIIDFLSEKNFKTYQVSKLNFFEQVYLFNNAKIIVGPHGAAFSNIIFSNPGLKIIELIPKNHPSIKCKKFSDLLGFEYTRVNLDLVDNQNKDKTGDMKISIPQLSEILKNIL